MTRLMTLLDLAESLGVDAQNHICVGADLAQDGEFSPQVAADLIERSPAIAADLGPAPGDDDLPVRA